jgi:predicted thioesterase
MMPRLAVTLTTLESHNHIVGDIEKGVKIFNRGGVGFNENESNFYLARVPNKDGSFKTVSVTFSRDGQDIEHHFCDCTMKDKYPPVCRHVIAAVLAIQGGIIESRLTLGKTAIVKDIVNDSNTAKTVGSGSLNVYATPMLVALMEHAACDCIADALEPNETSVGTEINISHTAASPLGREISASATIKSVFGRKIEFAVKASDSAGEIGNGKHTRVIVDAIRFTEKTSGRNTETRD